MRSGTGRRRTSAIDRYRPVPSLEPALVDRPRCSRALESEGRASSSRARVAAGLIHQSEARTRNPRAWPTGQSRSVPGFRPDRHDFGVRIQNREHVATVCDGNISRCVAPERGRFVWCIRQIQQRRSPVHRLTFAIESSSGFKGFGCRPGPGDEHVTFGFVFDRSDRSRSGSDLVALLLKLHQVSRGACDQAQAPSPSFLPGDLLLSRRPLLTRRSRAGSEASTSSTAGLSEVAGKARPRESVAPRLPASPAGQCPRRGPRFAAYPVQAPSMNSSSTGWASGSPPY